MLNKCQVDYAVTELVRYYTGNDPLLASEEYKNTMAGFVQGHTLVTLRTWFSFALITPPEGLYDETE